MLYSYRIEQAIRAASLLHQKQKRKGTVPLPYVTHLFAVAFILSDYTDDEDIIIAGLLHDTLEDTEYTEEELREDFGRRVCEIVRAVSEHVGEGAIKSWKERKKLYVKQLSQAPQEALMVSCADKIHNMRSIIESYYDNYDKFLKDFGGSVEERVWAYQGISNVLNRRLKSDIVHEFNHVFTEYKKFTLNEDR